MRVKWVALIGCALVVALLIVLAAIGFHNAVTPLATVGVLVLLVGGGNLLYGKNSHGAAAQARTRPAQEAQDRAIDEARRAAAARHDTPTEGGAPPS
ncbi:MAG TPA: hypothetical protein VND70_00535 [Acidimicrobiales bacterium]|nr:hypothetical protein [Acidimicrobiales bacterium]